MMFIGIFIGLLKQNSLSGTLADKTRVPSERERWGAPSSPARTPAPASRAILGKLAQSVPRNGNQVPCLSGFHEVIGANA